jgi:hypothetical protein
MGVTATNQGSQESLRWGDILTFRLKSHNAEVMFDWESVL